MKNPLVEREQSKPARKNQIKIFLNTCGLDTVSATASTYSTTTNLQFSNSPYLNYYLPITLWFRLLALNHRQSNFPVTIAIFNSPIACVI